MKQKEKKMSNLGIFASRFNNNSRSLREFDKAIALIKRNKDRKDVSREELKKLLNVIKPIIEEIKNNMTTSTAISERNVTEILRSRNERIWPTYRQKLIELNTKLSSSDFLLEDTDLQILEDIADALDTECENLFRRLSEG